MGRKANFDEKIKKGPGKKTKKQKAPTFTKKFKREYLRLSFFYGIEIFTSIFKIKLFK